MTQRLQKCPATTPFQGDPTYWYWYRQGQAALLRRGCRADRRVPREAPEPRSPAYYAFLDGYHVRHGFR